MAPRSTIYLIRHAEGFHQLPHDHPDHSIRDPSLTEHGVVQSERFCSVFPHHDEVDLICASPLRRTLQTALIAFKPETERGLKVVAVPDAQEATNNPCDMGSDVKVLREEFGEQIDYDCLTKADCIVLVTHGLFAHYLTGSIDRHGQRTGEYWSNVMWRSFHFADAADEPEARLFETEESKRKPSHAPIRH